MAGGISQLGFSQEGREGARLSFGDSRFGIGAWVPLPSEEYTYLYVYIHICVYTYIYPSSPSEEGALRAALRTFARKSRPESGLDCLMCATFASVCSWDSFAGGVKTAAAGAAYEA